MGGTHLLVRHYLLRKLVGPALGCRGHPAKLVSPCGRVALQLQITHSSTSTALSNFVRVVCMHVGLLSCQ